jgi:rhodanese-related sulfurtransferase
MGTLRGMEHSPRFLALVEEARAQVREVSVDDVVAERGRGEPVVLVDVREDHEFAAGHPSGAVHVGRGVLERDAERLWPAFDTRLALLCGGGFRSALAAAALQRMGFTQVVSVAGGMRAWRAAGLPEERVG